MASTEGRRAFLLSITLSELSFIMFFLLMIISASVLHKTKQALAEETKKTALQAEVLQVQQASEDQFKRLQLLESRVMQVGGFASEPSEEQLDSLFSKLQEAQSNANLVQLNAQLKAQLQILEAYQQLAEAIQATGVEVEQPALALKQLLQQVTKSQQAEKLLKERLAYMQKKLQGNGLDHAPCWANPMTGAIEYLYTMTLYENQIHIAAAWPKHRYKELLQISGARELAGKQLTQQQLQQWVQPIFAWSVAHECRHFVRIKDDAHTSKAAFKRQMLAIENYFYKYLQR